MQVNTNRLSLSAATLPVCLNASTVTKSWIWKLPDWQ